VGKSCSQGFACHRGNWENGFVDLLLTATRRLPRELEEINLSQTPCCIRPRIVTDNRLGFGSSQRRSGNLEYSFSKCGGIIASNAILGESAFLWLARGWHSLLIYKLQIL
jgi:hypothetical protein